jgi:hypothetical protein
MDKDEPPQCLLKSFPMLIGRNSRGQWVAQSQNGLCGGLFVNRTEAVRYALFENGHRSDAIIMVRSPLELALNDQANAAAAVERFGKADLPNRWSAEKTPQRVPSQTEGRPSLTAS